MQRPARVEPAFDEPFVVGAQDTANLTAAEFVQFMAHLLRAEVRAYGGGPQDILVNFAPGQDAGQDARTTRSIVSSGGDDTLIPIGETVWQLKAEAEKPTKPELKEELNKDQVKDCLAGGGHYVFAAQQPGVNENKVDQTLREIATSAGCPADNVRFLAQSRLAEYARRHPQLALLACFGRDYGSVEPFEVWAAGRPHDIPWEPTGRTDDVQRIQNALARQGFVHIAITGPTGVGKTRLALESIRGARLESSVAYARSSDGRLDEFVAHVRQHRARCILVVDECSDDVAGTLRERLQNVSGALITIAAEREGGARRAPVGDEHILLDPLPTEAVARILSGIEGLTPPQRQWIAEKTGGYVKLAKLVCDEIAQDGRLAGSLGDLSAITVVENALRRMLGDDEKKQLWLGLMACFAQVRATGDGGQVSELLVLADKLGLSEIDSNQLVEKTRKASIVEARGEVLYVTPDLLAQWMKEGFLRVQGVPFRRWLSQLPIRLQEAHARQLERLRATESGQRLAAEFLAEDGPFGDLLAERQPLAEKILLALGTASNDAATARLAAWAESNPSAAGRVAESRAIQRLLFRLMWLPDGFDRLFKLLVDAYDVAGAPESGELQRLLFGMLLRGDIASTRAPYRTVVQRVRDELKVRSGPVRSRLVTALADGLFGGSGEGYTEADRDHVFDKPRDGHLDVQKGIEEVFAILVESLDDSELEVQAQAARLLTQLGREMVALHGLGLHEVFLGLIPRLVELDGRVGVLAQELDAILAYDSPSPAIAEAVRGARMSLAETLGARVRLLVEGWAGSDGDERLGPSPDEAAAELLELDDDAMANELGALFEPWAKNPAPLVLQIAKHRGAQRAWNALLEHGRRAGTAWPCALFLASARNFGNAQLAPSAAALLRSEIPFDREVAANALTMSRATSEEISAVAEALKAGTVAPSWMMNAQVGRWNERQAPNDLRILLEALLAHPEGANLALAIAFRVDESKQAVPDELLVRVLVVALGGIRGHSAWTWEHLGQSVAKRAAALLLQSLVEALRTTDPHRVEDEVAAVLYTCITVANQAELLLQLWEYQPYVVSKHLGHLVLEHIPRARLVAWARSDPARETALGRMLPAADSEVTIQLVEEFGERSTLASQVATAARSGAFSGPPSSFYGRRAEEWASIADRTAEHPHFHRFASRLRDSLRQAARTDEIREAEEDALER